MNHQTTLSQMKAMKLSGMATAFQTSLESRSFERLTPDEWIACLLEAEWNHRQNQRLRRSLANARFRYRAALPDVDHQTARNLDTNQWQRFVQSQLCGPARECDYYRRYRRWKKAFGFWRWDTRPA